MSPAMIYRWALPVRLASLALFALTGASCTTSKENVGDAPTDGAVAETGTEADANPGTCGDANVKTLQASNYDQSCNQDSDCVAIGEGNACAPCGIRCTNAAINVSAHTQYTSDVGIPPAASQGETCVTSCPAEFAPCCRGGTCRSDLQCTSPASDAAAPDSGDGAAGNVDPCGGSCGPSQKCVQLGAGPSPQGAPICAGAACGNSNLDGSACPMGETCQTVTYDPCPPAAPGHVTCNIASVTYQGCVAAPMDASAE